MQQYGKDLQSRMDTLDATDSQAMLKMQFQLGQYNALLEATSTVTKSLVDEAKSLAQRTG